MSFGARAALVLCARRRGGVDCERGRVVEDVACAPFDAGAGRTSMAGWLARGEAGARRVLAGTWGVKSSAAWACGGARGVDGATEGQGLGRLGIV